MGCFLFFVSGREIHGISPAPTETGEMECSEFHASPKPDSKPSGAGLSRKGRRKERIWNFPGTYGNRGNGVQRVSSDATESFVSPAHSIRTVGASIARPPVLSAAFHGCAMHAPAAAKNGSEKPSNRETRRQTATRRPAVCFSVQHGITTIIYKNLDYLKTLYYDIAEITPAEW